MTDSHVTVADRFGQPRTALDVIRRLYAMRRHHGSEQSFDLLEDTWAATKNILDCEYDTRPEVVDRAQILADAATAMLLDASGVAWDRDNPAWPPTPDCMATLAQAREVMLRLISASAGEEW